MGVSFPFVQALVADRVERSAGAPARLLFANICGNVAGTLLTGFVLIDALGTAGTYRLLTGRARGRRRRAPRRSPLPRRAVASSASPLRRRAAGLAARRRRPSNHRLWAFLHGVDDDGSTLAEDRTLRGRDQALDGERAMLSINGVDPERPPVRRLPRADRARARAGAPAARAGPRHRTRDRRRRPTACCSDPRVDEVDTVELCGGQYDLLRDLADAGAPEFAPVLDDPRLRTQRRRRAQVPARATTSRYDIITVDTLRPTSAFSGSLYSRRVLRARRRPAQRRRHRGPVGADAAGAQHRRPGLPLHARLPGRQLPRSVFFLASRQPIAVDGSELQRRMATLAPDAFSAGQRQSLERYVAVESGPQVHR